MEIVLISCLFIDKFIFFCVRGSLRVESNFWKVYGSIFRYYLNFCWKKHNIKLTKLNCTVQCVKYTLMFVPLGKNAMLLGMSIN